MRQSQTADGRRQTADCRRHMILSLQTADRDVAWHDSWADNGPWQFLTSALSGPAGNALRKRGQKRSRTAGFGREPIWDSLRFAWGSLEGCLPAKGNQGPGTRQCWHCHAANLEVACHWPRGSHAPWDQPGSRKSKAVVQAHWTASSTLIPKASAPASFGSGLDKSGRHIKEPEPPGRRRG